MAEVNVGGVAGSRRQIVLLVAAVVFMLIAVGGFLVLQYTGNRDRTWADLAKEFSSDAESMEKAGRSAQPDFATLGALADDYDQNVQGLRQGDSSAGISKLPGSLQKPLDAVATSWNTMHTAINDILANEKQFGHVADNVGVINDAAAAAGADYEQIANHMGAHGAPSSHIFLAASQQVRLEQIKSAVLQLLNSGRDGAANAQALNKLAIEFNERQSQLLNSSAAAEPAIAAALTRAGNDFAPIATAAATISQDASGLAKLQTAAAGLQANATDLIANAKSLEQALLDYNGARGKVLPYVIVGSGIAAVLSLLGFVALFFSGVRERLVDAESRDSRQQQAILNLLDEITNLANGDLTVDVTVTEDFTGAIADSINYTVQTLRGLVGTINSTSEQIVAAAASTQDTAQRMSRASDRQAREVSAAASSITTTSQQLQDVAGSAERLAVQAQTSVQVAHGGAATVGRTIQNMAALREQIQDTAKRIKRLGESSQEIGNIIEFINDIAEQTNTLALNASIQAAMAGEAGRGFAVVADEVQRLAERAGSATRQIETLVKTIQADTNEAIISMERSTANVVAGAKSAEEAGQSLTRIESSSQELAKLIQDISVAAKGQSAEANKIAGTMQGIREIAVQTSGSANTTAQAIGELNALSDKLRESVAGFKLPESMETPAHAA